MKKFRWHLIIFSVLLLVAAFFFITRKTGTLNRELKDFAVEDTASITKIFMVDKSNQMVTLTRENNHWMVNGKFRARKDGIFNLLKTINRLDVKAPVPKSSFETVVKNLAASSVKVEIYSDRKKPEKVFYVGGASKDETGTYMMLENSSTPFVMHIPGFSGYLTTRFFLNELLWRDPQIFHYQFNDIRTVSIQYIEKPKESFKVTNNGNNHFTLTSLLNNQTISHFDTIAVKNFIGGFKNLSYEYINSSLKKNQIDSVLKSKPVHIFSLTDKEGKTTTIKTFTKPGTGVADENGIAYKFDLDKMYASINDEKEIVVIQYFVFNPLFLEINSLIKK